MKKDYFETLEGDLDKFQKIFIDLQISKNYRMIKKNLQIFFLKMSRILLLLFKNFKNSLINHEKSKKEKKKNNKSNMHPIRKFKHGKSCVFCAGSLEGSREDRVVVHAVERIRYTQRCALAKVEIQSKKRRRLCTAREPGYAACFGRS